jgi:hypothetical protein
MVKLASFPLLSSLSRHGPLTSVLHTLKGVRITFLVSGSNVVKRLDAKGDNEIRENF